MIVNNNGVNLQVYQSHFTHDSRMLKETQTLVQEGFFNQIFIGAIWKSNLKVREDIDDHRTVWRVPLWSGRLPEGLLGKAIKYLEWELRLFWEYRKENIRVFNAHSLIVLPLGVLFKLLKNCKLVYDSHELATEAHMGFKQRIIYKKLEAWLIRYIDMTIVVNDSIANWYKETYKLEKVYAIRNVPLKTGDQEIHSRVLRENFNINDDDIIFIYQGILEEGRGIELILDCFSQAERNKHIVFMGMGALEERIREYQNKYNNVHFQAAVPPSQVLYYTASADIGISLIENTCLNYYYCLPNKIFEYLFSGLPTIVSDFPEMAGIVTKEQCGWAISVEKGVLLRLVNNLSRGEIDEKKKYAQRCTTKYGWHMEAEKLSKIYRDLLIHQ